MANYKGHLFGGFAVFLMLMPFCINYLHTLTAYGISLGATLLGALFPDIDIKSKGQKLFYISIIPLFVLFCIRDSWIACFVLSLIAFIPLVVKHRGIFHNFWFIITCVIAISLLFANQHPNYQQLIQLAALFFAAGVVSHLWLDFGIRFLIHS